MATKYSVLIAGSEVDFWESIDFANSLDLSVNKAEVQFPDSTALLAAEGVAQDIQILRDGVGIWRGLGVSNQKIYDSKGKKQYNLNCLSNKIYLQKEIFQKSGNYITTYGGAQGSTNLITQPPLTSALSIFNDILASQTSPVGLSAGALGSVNIPHAALFITRQTAIQTLSQLIAASLWEARFNFNNTVDFGPNAGTNYPGTVGSPASVFDFQEDENLMKTEVDFGIDKLVNQVIICGAGSGTAQQANTASNGINILAKNSASIAAYGAWSKIINLANCLDPTLLQAYANALLDDLSGQVYTVKSELADLSTGVPFRMGDYVSVDNASFDLNGALFRVVSEQRHYDSQQQEDVNVVLAQNYRMVNVAHFRLKRLEEILNSQLQNQQVFNNNFNQTPTQLSLSVIAPQVNGLTSLPTIDTYAVISASGISAGCTLKVVLSQASGATWSSVNYAQVTDLVTLKVYSFGTGLGIPGTYSLTTTDDIYDHIMKFEVQGDVIVGTTGGVFYMSGEIQLSSPTVPT